MQCSPDLRKILNGDWIFLFLNTVENGGIVNLYACDNSTSVDVERRSHAYSI